MSLNILCSTSIVSMKFARAPFQVRPPPCLGRSHKLQRELGAYMEETVRRVTPRQNALIEGDGSSKFF